MTDRPVGSPFGRLGVRTRITLAAIVVVGVVLAVAAIGFARLTQDRIESSIVAGAQARADSVAALVAAGALEDPLGGRDPDYLAQVVDDSGVVAADLLVQGLGPFVAVDLGAGERSQLEVDALLEEIEDDERGIEDEGPYVIVALGVDLDSGPGTVLVAATTESAEAAAAAVQPLLLVGLPLLLAVLGATIWWLTGRALRPVEDIRTRAAEISGAELHSRLPVPHPEDEIRRLAETLNEMLARLEAAATAQKRFVADASHELLSPLAAVRTMLDVATAETRRREDLDLLTDLGEEVERMGRVVDDLLYLARHEEVPETARDEVDLDQVAGREARALELRSDVEIDASNLAPVRIRGDESALARLVRNLADNAARHASTRVAIFTGIDGGWALVVVSDDGPGVDPAERERIFERFVRLDDSRARAGGGAGLGLAVARTIARSHGGDLRVVEPTMGGATLEARLPLAADDADDAR